MHSEGGGGIKHKNQCMLKHQCILRQLKIKIMYSTYCQEFFWSLKKVWISILSSRKSQLFLPTAKSNMVTDFWVRLVCKIPAFLKRHVIKEKIGNFKALSASQQYDVGTTNQLYKVRPNKTLCLVPVTCPQKVGRVGRHFFLFYLFIYFYWCWVKGDIITLF